MRSGAALGAPGTSPTLALPGAPWPARLRLDHLLVHGEEKFVALRRLGRISHRSTAPPVVLRALGAPPLGAQVLADRVTTPGLPLSLDPRSLAPPPLTPPAARRPCPRP